jgi:hypothetical protein
MKYNSSSIKNFFSTLSRGLKYTNIHNVYLFRYGKDLRVFAVSLFESSSIKIVYGTAGKHVLSFLSNEDEMIRAKFSENITESCPYSIQNIKLFHSQKSENVGLSSFWDTVIEEEREYNISEFKYISPTKTVSIQEEPCPGPEQNPEPEIMIEDDYSEDISEEEVENGDEDYEEETEPESDEDNISLVSEDEQQHIDIDVSGNSIQVPTTSKKIMWIPLVCSDSQASQLNPIINRYVRDILS